MMLLRILLLAFLMSPATATADDASRLATALEKARTDRSVSFDLDVDCTNNELRRSLKVVGGKVAVWNRSMQIRLATEDRNALLDALLEADFARFEARYGEPNKAEMQEAPLRVSCRIRIELDELEKSSIQLLDGEQSKELLGLAGQLLDRVGALADQGIVAGSLEDGLLKLGHGVLAPEVLELRLVMLPDDAGKAGGGSILRIENGKVYRQPYSPGQSVGEVDKRTLTPGEFGLLVNTLHDAKVWELPVNLTADELTEFDVSVLGQRKSVVARASFRPASAQMQSDFVRLLAELEKL